MFIVNWQVQKTKNPVGVKYQENSVCVKSNLHPKKESERRPRSLATHGGSLKDFVGEEAPEARVGPRNRRSR